MTPGPTVSGSSVTSGRCCARSQDDESRTKANVAADVNLIRSEPPLTVEQDRDGTVVDERHVHVCLEHAGFDDEAAAPQLADEILVKSLRDMRRGRAVERRPASLPAVCAEGELGHDEHRAIAVDD